jgi:hypothetical protein
MTTVTTYTVYNPNDGVVYARGLTAVEAMSEILTYDGYRYEIRTAIYENLTFWELWHSDASGSSMRGASHMRKTRIYSAYPDATDAAEEIAREVIAAQWPRMPQCLSDAEYNAMQDEAVSEAAEDTEIEQLTLETVPPKSSATLAAENVAQARRRTAQAAARLESGYWEHETTPFDAQLYDVPWCGRVIDIKGLFEMTYEWGTWCARPDSGLLCVACKPGEIVAWGQKAISKMAASKRYILQMQDDGSMREINVNDVWRHLRYNK